MLTFSMWQSDQNRQWYFNISSNNGEKVAQSEGYIARQSAAHAIDLIRGQAAKSRVQEYRFGSWMLII